MISLPHVALALCTQIGLDEALAWFALSKRLLYFILCKLLISESIWFSILKQYWWGHPSSVRDERINMRKDVSSYKYLKSVLLFLFSRVFLYLVAVLSSLVSYRSCGKSRESYKPIKATTNKSCRDKVGLMRFEFSTRKF